MIHGVRYPINLFFCELTELCCGPVSMSAVTALSFSAAAASPQYSSALLGVMFIIVMSANSLDTHVLYVQWLLRTLQQQTPRQVAPKPLPQSVFQLWLEQAAF